MSNTLCSQNKGNPDSNTQKLSGKITNLNVNDSLAPKNKEDSLKSKSAGKDTLILIYSRYDSLNNTIKLLKDRVHVLEVNHDVFSMNNILLYGALGMSLLNIVILIAIHSKTKKSIFKINSFLYDNKSHNTSNEFTERSIKKINIIDKDVEEIKKILTQLNDFNEITKEEFQNLHIKINAITSFGKNYELQEQAFEDRKSEIRKEIDSKPKSVFYNVDYFVESGIVTFKETNQATPFYIEKYPDKSELTINEDVIASSNYSESIRRCFEVDGQMSGKYKNIKPALCEFIEFSSSWKLIEKGFIRSC